MKIQLHTQVIIGIVMGTIVGLMFRDQAAYVLSPVADMFVRSLKMIIVPLVFSSLVMGVVNFGNVQHLGKIGARTFVYYMTTTVLAVLLGLFLVNVVRPGDHSDVDFQLVQIDEYIERSEAISFQDLLTDIIPENIILAMVEGDMLAIIFFSILVGVALNLIGKKGEGFVRFVDGLNEVMLRVTHWIMLLAPIGVFALMAVLIARTGFSAFEPLAFYMLVVIMGLLIHSGVTLSLILIFVAKVSPIAFFKRMFPALATAFSTDSSLATIPVTIDCLENRVGTSNKVSGFVAPLGATLNMDGTALYEAVAAIFIAQVYGFDLSFVEQLTICVAATIASIGAAGIPSAGLVTMVIVLQLVGIPLEGIGLVLAVDRILDMFRTTVNVYGDSCGAAVIARLEGESFLLDSEEEEGN